jgi:hypothetical protein
MSVVFTQGQQLGPNDLTIILFDQLGNPFEPHLIYYEFYGKDPIRGEWRVGLGNRIPFQDQAGIYYVSERLSAGFIPGSYRIRWVIQRDPTSPLEIVKEQEFAFISV